MARMDATQKQYQKNVSLFRQAMTDYEKEKGGDCGNMSYSRLGQQPVEVVGPRVRIYELQGSSRKCGYRDYRAKIEYADDECFVVSRVEILEKISR